MNISTDSTGVKVSARLNLQGGRYFLQAPDGRSTPLDDQTAMSLIGETRNEILATIAQQASGGDAPAGLSGMLDKVLASEVARLELLSRMLTNTAAPAQTIKLVKPAKAGGSLADAFLGMGSVKIADGPAHSSAIMAKKKGRPAGSKNKAKQPA